MKAAQHPFETARVAALRRYDILDTPRESDFDDIVALCAQICEAPISVVNLIDTERQWFKAEVGLGVRETPLDTSLCAHVILENDFVEVADTLADCRMEDNPMCTADEGLRFYAGALLKSADGYPIGTLCVLDTKPRTLTEHQRHAIRVLARQVMAQLDLRALVARERALRREIDHRVKNSLQAVASFVALEQGSSPTEAVRTKLDSVAHQIHTIALLHRHIGSGSSSDRLDLDTYLTRVVELLDEAAPPGVTVSGQFDVIETGAKEASALAMIVNELTANAVKHAFATGEGQVRFTGTVSGERLLQLVCQDNGTQSAEPREDRRERLGLSIITASVAQLGGSLLTERTDDGLRTVIEATLT